MPVPLNITLSGELPGGWNPVPLMITVWPLTLTWSGFALSRLVDRTCGADVTVNAPGSVKVAPFWVMVTSCGPVGAVGRTVSVTVRVPSGLSVMLVTVIPDPKLRTALAVRFTPLIMTVSPVAPRPALVTDRLVNSGADFRVKFVLG